VSLSEARWTPPREDCPHPEWWHSTDDDSTELEVTELVAAFVRATQPEVVVETGTAWGQTAEAIGRALRVNGHGHLYTLEVDPVRSASARHRVRRLPVTVVEQPSLSFEPPGQIDLAWFDSLIDLRVPEYHHLRPSLAPGAIVGFHDAGPQHGYRDRVEALPGLRLIYLRTPRGVLFGEVL
jgi:predicted O-methyltransferase YrrM